jgi:hypothetical protein
MDEVPNTYNLPKLSHESIWTMNSSII